MSLLLNLNISHIPDLFSSISIFNFEQLNVSWSNSFFEIFQGLGAVEKRH